MLKTRTAVAILMVLMVGFVWLHYFAAAGPVRTKLVDLSGEVEYWRFHRSVVYPDPPKPGSRIGLFSSLPHYEGYAEFNKARVAYNTQVNVLNALRQQAVNYTMTVVGIGTALFVALLFVGAKRKTEHS